MDIRELKKLASKKLVFIKDVPYCDIEELRGGAGSLMVDGTCVYDMEEKLGIDEDAAVEYAVKVLKSEGLIQGDRIVIPAGKVFEIAGVDEYLHGGNGSYDLKVGRITFDWCYSLTFGVANEVDEECEVDIVGIK
jgi:hypothetical protein